MHIRVADIYGKLWSIFFSLMGNMDRQTFTTVVYSIALCAQKVKCQLILDLQLPKVSHDRLELFFGAFCCNQPPGGIRAFLVVD